MTDGLENSMTAMIATMQSYLPAQLLSLTATYSDGVPLPPPKQYYDGTRSEVPEYPSLFVWYPEDPEAVEKNSTSLTTASVMDNLIVEVAVTSDTENGVNMMARRYGDAIRKVLLQHQTLDGRVMSALPKTMVRSPAVLQGKKGEPRRKLIQSVAWRTEVRYFTDY